MLFIWRAVLVTAVSVYLDVKLSVQPITIATHNLLFPPSLNNYAHADYRLCLDNVLYEVLRLYIPLFLINNYVNNRRYN